MSDPQAPSKKLTTAYVHYESLERQPDDEGRSIRMYDADEVDAEIERLRRSLGEQETATSQIPSTRGDIAASGPRHGPSHEPKAGDGWRENATYLLDNCPHTIRVRDTEHPDELLTSLVVTFQKMQTLLERAAQPPVLSLDARIQRFPQRGWIIGIGCPFSYKAPGEHCPITFKATHIRDYSTGDVEECESLDLDGAVTWLEQRLGITKSAESP